MRYAQPFVKTPLARSVALSRLSVADSALYLALLLAAPNAVLAQESANSVGQTQSSSDATPVTVSVTPVKASPPATNADDVALGRSP
jgi:hypothetical protein